jgi:murein L,D-transpeptidase YcbB/YkuD
MLLFLGGMMGRIITLAGARLRGFGMVAGLAVVVGMSFAPMASAQVTAFRQAVAETAARDEDIAAFYRARNFEGIWSGDSAVGHRNALLAALENATHHGLPTNRYDVADLIAQMQSARTPAEMGAIEVSLTKTFLQYARDVQSGVLRPKSIDPMIVREVVYTPRLELLSEFRNSNPTTFLRSLPPSTPEYTRLVATKLRLETLQANGGWGPVVNASKLEAGASGPDVIALRNRLVAMGYMDRSVTASYDASIVAAVQAFQRGHGLQVDGTAGPSTISELNRPISERLQSIVVAMERERWFNQDKGDRHIWVNLTDFSAKVVDHGEVTFATRSVIGAVDPDRETPEFSDVMEYMVINPSWYVPRSIVTKEYLPQMQRNRGAASHLLITDRNGRTVNRANIDFNRYNERNFPFSMRQPPSPRNALGLVKFIFPNQYNIYLHDSPAKSLFGREVRAYSHGCIRLSDPFDFAYALLAKQTDDPEGLFQSRLRTGDESRIRLDEQVPVHLIYRTAFTTNTGAVEFRRDIYGRDRKIWNALTREGVVVPGVQG